MSAFDETVLVGKKIPRTFSELFYWSKLDTWGTTELMGRMLCKSKIWHPVDQSILVVLELDDEMASHCVNCVNPLRSTQ